LLRAGKPITLSITRGAIAIPSVDAYFMLDSSAAYLKLSKFTETSYEEFMYAMEALKERDAAVSFRPKA
jgi:carboxyl-terminal processing protease